MELGDWVRGARRAGRFAVQVRAVAEEVRRRSDERRRRRARAEDATTPPEELAELAGDDDLLVRLAVARNRATPPDVLRRLAQEPPPAPGPGGPRVAANSRWAVASNPSTPDDLLVELAGDGDAHVRGMAAANPATPTAAVLALAGDPDEFVRTVVAGREDVPVEVLVGLAADAEPGGVVAHALVDNPSCPDDVRHRLRSTVGDPPPEAEPEPSERFFPTGLTKMTTAVVAVRRLARQEERHHPDDPGMAVLGPRAYLVKRLAMELAAQGREDRPAADELVERSEGHPAALRRSALWLRCDGQASEYRHQSRAHRLLQAAMSGGPVPALAEPEAALIEELEALRARTDAFEALCGRQPRLTTLVDAVRPIEGPVAHGVLDVEGVPVRTWVALSFPFAVHAFGRVPVLGREIPAELVRLVGDLEHLVGPTCGAPDPVLRSHTASNIAVKHCVPRLRASPPGPEVRPGSSERAPGPTPDDRP